MSIYLKQLKSDYQTIINTKFWEVYQKEILAKANNASTDNDNFDPITDATKLARSQGKLTAFKIILGLPDTMLKDK